MKYVQIIRLMVAFATVGAAGAMLACTMVACTPRNEEQAGAPLVVRVAEVQSEVVSPTIETYGTITYVEKADVFAAVEGVITALYVEEGDIVARGDLLARIDDDPLRLRQARFAAELRARQARSDLAHQRLLDGRREVEAQLIRIGKAEREIEQRRLEYETLATTLLDKRSLLAVGGVAEQEVEGLAATVSSARVALEQAIEDLRIRMLGFRDVDMQEAGMTPPEDEEERRAMLVDLNTRALDAELRTANEEATMVQIELEQIELLLDRSLVRAPLAGVISARYRYVGEQAGADMPIVTIFGIDRLDVQVEIGEEDVASIARGQQATVVSQGREYIGQVRLIQPFVDARSRSALVRIAVEDEHRSLRPGLFARATIASAEEQQRLLVPEATLVADPAGGQSLFVVQGAHLYRASVELGERIGDRRIVLSRRRRWRYGGRRSRAQLSRWAAGGGGRMMGRTYRTQRLLRPLWLAAASMVAAASMSAAAAMAVGRTTGRTGHAGLRYAPAGWQLSGRYRQYQRYQ